MPKRVVLAIDIGASSGRGILGVFDGKHLRTREIGRFQNYPTRLHGGIYWNYVQIYEGIISLLCACKKQDLSLDCIAFDTWSQDYGLLNADGRVLGMPRCYRDPVIEKSSAHISEKIDAERLFSITGNSSIGFSTLKHLISDKVYFSESFTQAKKLLFMAGLFTWMISSVYSCDFTIPSIGNLMDIKTKTYSNEITDTFGLTGLLPDIEAPGKIIGKTNQTIQELTGYTGVPVAIVGGHDTSSAVAAIPSAENFLCISSGTWSMLGLTRDGPLFHPYIFKQGFSNFLTAAGNYSVMRGISGMYLVQQCMRKLFHEGGKVDYDRLDGYALTHENAESFDVDMIDIAEPDIPGTITKLIRQTGGRGPEKAKEYYQSIVCSLAEKYAKTIAELETISGHQFDRIYIFGGGTKARALNVLTARQCKKDVLSGYPEAAALGNLLFQLIALGELCSADIPGVKTDDVFRVIKWDDTTEGELV
jgi:rhamnulokinase